MIKNILLLGLAAALFAGAWGCGDDPPSGPSPAPENNNPDVSCATSAECDAVPATAGQRCVEGACVPCSGDAECAADPDYGDARGVCEAGACTASGCTPGAVGCACDAEDACAVGECLDGACVDCDRGDAACLCRLNGTCAADLRCEEERCVPCTAGLEGCACGEGDACDAPLVCGANQRCIPDPCTPGAAGCPCADGDACDAGGYCDDASMCRACTSDVPGCPCDAGDTCAGDNICEDGACVACPDADRPEGCGCEDDDACAEGLVCDDDDLACRAPLACADLCVLHQRCDASLPGDAVCIPESCEDGYVWDDGVCLVADRASCDGRDGSEDMTPACEAEGKRCVETANGAVCVVACAELTATCAEQQRDCDPNAFDEDATCGPCRPGYLAEGGACVPNPQSNCVPDALDSILDTCTARLQACVTTDDGAICGACLAGTVLDPDANACVPQALCGDRLCTDEEFCDYPQTGGPPACAPRLCPDGQAFDVATNQCMGCGLTCGAAGVWPRTIDGACACAEDVFCDYTFNGAGARCVVAACPDGEAATPGGECITCSLICGDSDGETPRLWPETTADGSCLCETQTGYYYPLGGSGAPQRCDEDGDGWINRTAFETYSISEPTTLANFRCEVRQIDRFILRNEYGQERRVSLCGGELVDYDDGTPPPCGQDAAVLALYEPDNLDNPRRIAVDNATFPTYGPEGRKPLAAELNPLTRGCVSPTGDYNLNGREDLSEDQPLTRDRVNGLSFDGDADFAFQSMAYFTELHRGSYRAPSVRGLPGAYVIAERSRCEAGFPVRYASGGDYWQGCTRNRRSSFDVERTSLVGHDFAAWSCDAESGTCPLPNPPLGSGLDRDGDRVEDHDLCALEGALTGQPWRGMSHHSQFQCVTIKNSAAQPWEVNRSDLFDGATGGTPLEFNLCGAVTCDGAAPGCVTSTRSAPLQPLAPEVRCATALQGDTQPDMVGFVGVRYLPDGPGSSVRPSYQRGCIDESFWQGSDGGYAFLCPGYEDNPAAVRAAGNAGDFGKLICSCNTFYGGASCEVACLERSQSSGVGTSYLHVGGEDLGYDATLAALYGCDPDFRYCVQHPPVPEAGFEGGRRGWWLCGETTSTRPAQGSDPVLRAADAPEGVWSLEGKVRVVPVRRRLLTEPACDPAVDTCWSLF